MTTPAITELTKLQKSLSGERVLSVYFTAKSNNPSQRNAWRAHLKAELRRLDKTLSAAEAVERKAFDAARKAFDALEIPELSYAEGIACFVTARGVQRVERLPFSVETSLTWSRGVALAPFVRALKSDRPAILAVSDGQSAHLYLFRNARMQALEEIHVEAHLRQATHMSAGIAPKFHSGTRGITGTDEAQREWSAAMERLAHRTALQIAHHAGEHGWVILGGRPDVVHRIHADLPKGVQARTGEAAGITVHSAPHELERALRDGASALRNADDARALKHLADGGDERHGAALGENAAHRALERASVARLYLSPRYVTENSVRAETAVQAALQQGADIETVSGVAGLALDSMGGIAARLRYSLP